MPNKNDPFKNLILDAYEQELENQLAKTSIKLTPPSSQKISQLQKAAHNTTALLKKDTQINLRIPLATKLALQRKAAKLGLRYQTLIGSILHQYAHSD